MSDIEKEVEQVDTGVAELTLKKKKKKSDKVNGDVDGVKKEKKRKPKTKDEDGDTVVPELVLTDKKKKKKKGDPEKLELGVKKPKKRGPKSEKNAVNKATGRLMEELAEEDKVNFDYETLCDRVFTKMRSHGIGKDVKEAKRFTVPPPKMVRMGTKRTVYQNFGVTCAEHFGRDHKHVMSYILNELGATGNLDVNKALIIKGKFKPSQMENILRAYIKEYIICKTCKGNNTYLQKHDRLMFIICHDCSSRSTVIQNKVGYTAITGKRRKLREKEGSGPAPAAMKAK